MPDYYNVLRIGHNASRKDITQAYERLMKESQYDTTIDRVAVETAFRILSDIATKAQYDARQTLRMKRIQGNDTVKKVSGIRFILDWFTIQRLLAILGVLVLFTIGFYWLRFGYKLNDFQTGDVLYRKHTNVRYGKILRIEDHHFDDHTEKAFLIELDKAQITIGSADKTIWIQQDVIKGCCYKQ